MKTYTEHQLTDAMLRRLSKAANGRNPGGTSTIALQNRGLVRYFPGTSRKTEITEAGRVVLAQARREGW